MKQVTFRCNLISPLFMVGAKSPEIRATSIKGLLRYWWRAASMINSVETLSEIEATLFGPLQVRVEHSFTSKEKFSLGTDHNGINYLLYPVKGKSYFFDDNQFLEVILQSTKEDTLEQSIAAFWCLIFFGAMGSRSRRGAGCLQIMNPEEINPMSSPDFSIQGSNGREIEEWLYDNFSKVRKCIGADREKEAPYAYANLSLSRLIVSQNGFNSWSEALEAIGQKYYHFRKLHSHEKFNSAIFGLSINSKTSNISITPASINHRNSPLVIKILKVQGFYYWMLLRLSGEFLPKEALLVLTDRNSGQESTTQKPDYELLNEFWYQIKRENEIMGGNERMLPLPDQLEKICFEIKSKLDPNRIILFGSKASGNYHSKSDWDIAIDTESTIESLDLMGIFDLINYRTASDELKSNIDKEGVILYEKTNHQTYY